MITREILQPLSNMSNSKRTSVGSTSRPSRSLTADLSSSSNNNGYGHVLVKPLEVGSKYCSLILGVIGLPIHELTSRQLCLLCGCAALITSFVGYQLIVCDYVYLLYRLCAFLVPLFSIVCLFYFLALYYRNSWTPTGIYLFFCACVAGEIIGQCLSCGQDILSVTSVESDDQGMKTGNPEDYMPTKRHSVVYLLRPVLMGCFLVTITTVSLLSLRTTKHCLLLIISAILIRFMACVTVTFLPAAMRPFLAYFGGISGVILSKYVETVLRHPAMISAMITQDGKIPVIRRRRTSSAANLHPVYGHEARRTSLPALGMQKNHLQQNQVRIR